MILPLRILALVACAPLVACASAPRPTPTIASLQDGIARDVVRMATPDGEGLFTRSWRVAPRPAKAAVVIVHDDTPDADGDREHVFAETLARAGYAVYGPDLRRFGRDATVRGVADRFDDVVGDLSAAVDGVRAAEGDVPVFLVGVGQGGTVALRLAERRAVAGVVAAGTTVDLELHPTMLAGGNGVDDYYALFAPVTSRLGIRTLRFGAVRALWHDVDALRAPVLLVQGADDDRTTPVASRDFLASLPSGDRTMTVYDGLDRGLLQDPRNAVVPDVVAWIERRAGGALADPGVATAAPRSPVPVERTRAAASSIELGWGMRFYEGGDHVQALTARARLSYGAPLGWEGEVAYDRDRVMAYPAGVALRFAGTGRIGIAAGAGLLSFWTPTAGGTLSLDVPMGSWLTGVAGGDVSYRWEDDASGVDVRARAGLRVGRHRRYGRTTYAGSGIALLGVYERSAGLALYGFALGVDLDALR